VYLTHTKDSGPLFVRKDFRDFVLAWMLSVESSSIDPTLDNWSNNVRPVLVPHLQLSSPGAESWKLNYGMIGREAVVGRQDHDR